ncbi:hypothetical protein PZA11_003960 [Diplocarpon coronariae]|uniref:Complex I intermediate-associated protein 84 n=1 Tax=Diplocarpon coronariae TaxID=2795749 RepID=A0A218ZBU9_9HELO|nr:hypothetical protein JHW43_001434 [Diplocarpon mali]OWP05080.1 hypothetical protein B2J93_8293 [Marssonina coronariae]
MRSHLTRSVFRRLLSHEGLIFHCPSRIALLSRHPRHHVSPSTIRSGARRTLFGFSQKAARQPKEASLPPGMRVMLELSLMEKMQTRAPKAADLVKAWRTYFEYKLRRKEGINNMHMMHVLRVFKHLQKLGSKEEGEKLSIGDMRLPARALHNLPLEKPELHAELARLLYAEWLKAPATVEQRHDDFRSLADILSRTGNAKEARELVQAREEAGEEYWQKKRRAAWTTVLSGFAKENNEAELLDTFTTAEGSGCLAYTWRVQMIMVNFYASRDDLENTKKWFSKPLARGEGIIKDRPAPESLAAILKFCVRNNELDWCRSIFREVLDSNPGKKYWDVILQWAAGAMGKGVEDVERMIGVMIRRSNPKLPVKPNIKTINGLVELAIAQNDPYIAERYITLGAKFGIQPNAKTYIMQMNYRADANDLRGAQAAYDSLQGEEVENDEDLPAINRFLRALCVSKSDNHTRIASIILDLEERDKRLEAATVCTLTKLFLQRDETHELIDLLQTQVYHFTLEERASIINTIIAFCTSPSTHVVRSWEAYNIMRQIFDETTTAQRTMMMNEYFSRSRSDMACHVFGHMRQHPILDRRPKIETYIQCFEGIGACIDRESLDMVHNMLKMDSSIEPTTRLYNALMLAYTACDGADRALNFWDDITNTDEGPSYRSLELVFWACGHKPFGDRKARDIWAKMRRMEIEVTGDVFAAYVGALSGQGKFEEAKDMVESSEASLGLKPDVLTIGTFYNSIPSQNRKDLVEEWAKALYPEVWKQLSELGQTTQDEGHRLFNLKIVRKA